MADQAEALRRLVRARLDWKELTDEPSDSRPVERVGGLRAFLEFIIGPRIRRPLDLNTGATCKRVNRLASPGGGTDG
jgi:hypothetical protein